MENRGRTIGRDARNAERMQVALDHTAESGLHGAVLIGTIAAWEDADGIDPYMNHAMAGLGSGSLEGVGLQDNESRAVAIMRIGGELVRISVEKAQTTRVAQRGRIKE